MKYIHEKKSRTPGFDKETTNYLQKHLFLT